jgi:chitodextrinase
LSIGNLQPGLNRGFAGSIDEVRVYNRVLTTTEIQALADSTTPSAPTSPSATAVSASQINVAWTASTDNVAVTGYRVERCQGASCTTFSQVATPTSSPYNDTGLSSNTTYRYQVRAVDANTNASGASTPIVSATTSSGGDTQAPSVPTGLTAAPQSSTQIDVSWNASTDNVGVTGYELQRCQGSGCTSWGTVATPTGTTLNDTGLSAGTTYRYQVRARDAVPNWSVYTSPVTASTNSGDSQAPTAPTLAVVASNSIEIDLSWSGATDNVGVVGYNVYRCSGAGCTPTGPQASPFGTTFNDTGLTASTSYSYYVKARDAAGNLSPASNTVTKITAAGTFPDCK